MSNPPASHLFRSDLPYVKGWSCKVVAQRALPASSSEGGGASSSPVTHTLPPGTSFTQIGSRRPNYGSDRNAGAARRGGGETAAEAVRAEVELELMYVEGKTKVRGWAKVVSRSVAELFIQQQQQQHKAATSSDPQVQPAAPKRLRCPALS